MTYDQALTWLLQVDGRLYYANPKERKPNSWVAVVRVPADGASAGKLIIATGESAEQATAAAEEKWQTLWDGLSTMH